MPINKPPLQIGDYLFFMMCQITIINATPSTITTEIISSVGIDGPGDKGVVVVSVVETTMT